MGLTADKFGVVEATRLASGDRGEGRGEVDTISGERLCPRVVQDGGPRGSEGDEGGCGLDGRGIMGRRGGVWSHANRGDEGSAQEIFGGQMEE